MLKNKLNIALIGLGYWGKICLKTLLQISTIDIKYIVTSQQNPKNIPTNIQLLNSWGDLLKKQDIDGIIITSPSATHYDIAKSFIKKSIPVFIEKPMTLCVKQAQHLCHLEEQINCPVVVDHILLFSPAFRSLCTYIKNNTLQIKSILFTAGKPKAYSHDISLLWEWAPHDLAMCFYLLNSQIHIESVFQTKKNIGKNYFQEINLTCFLDEIDIEFKWSTLIKSPTRSIIIDCLDRRIELNDKKDPKINIYFNHKKTETLPYSSQAPLTLAFEHFISCIHNNNVSFSNTSLGLEVVRTIANIEKKILQN